MCMFPGGLSGDILKSYDPAAIDAWTLTGIQHIPAKALQVCVCVCVCVCVRACVRVCARVSY